MCMHCNVLIVNQGGGLHVSETVLGVAGVTRVCFGCRLSAVGYVSVNWFWLIKNYDQLLMTRHHYVTGEVVT